jgi:manganese transport protein
MVLLATAMVGATVMPHVIYLHSALARDRHGKVSDSKLREYLRVTKWDVIMAMCIAGMVNIAMLLLAASALQGQGSLADFEAIFHGIDARLGSLVAILFAVGLLISGFASTAVGSQAGSVIMDGLTDIRISIFARRCLTISPSLILLWAGANPSWLLLISQVGLSIGVPFALIPLLLITSRKSIMGRWVNGRWLTLLISVITILITLLNLVLLIGYI